jgi:3-oxoacyl-[acyl-carrier-protein] synthase-3
MILGAGRALGSRLVTNEEVCRGWDWTPEQIVAKTGIRQRYEVSGESTASLALRASTEALRNAGVSPAEIGMTIGCTFTHDYLFPPLAAKLHHDLGMKGGTFFDIQANCSGFITALVTVCDRMARDPFLRYALICGAEVLSPFTPSDPEIRMYFSDGAGAVVISRPYYKCLVSAAFDADTSNYESVRATPDDPIEMSGLATWAQAVKHLPFTVRRAVADAGWTTDQVDLVIMHQANLRLIEFLMSRLGLPMTRAFTNVAEIGNTGAASLPIAIADAIELGRWHGKIVLAGIGAGFGFAACAIEIGVPHG